MPQLGARTEILRHRGAEPPFPDTFEDVIRRAAASAAASGLLHAAVLDDFDCGGIPYSAKPDWPNAASTAMERHYALNWLCGGGPWDEVHTDT